MIQQILYFFLMSTTVLCEPKIVCYWFNGDLTTIDPNLCTHIHYSFVFLDNNTLTIKFAYANDSDTVKSLVKLRTQNPKLKIIAALGGYTDSVVDDKYSRLVADAKKRTNFVKTAVEFVIKNDFDGLDFDWEYPACPETTCDAAHASEKANFATLLKELSNSLHSISSRQLSLSSAVNAGQWLGDQAYDYSALNSTLDYINIMTYDNAGMWNHATGHHAGYTWATSSMSFWAQHASKSKLLLGVPFYGVSFTLQNSSQHQIGAPINASDAIVYHQICQNVKKNGWKKENTTDGPIAYKGDQWVGYDDPNNILKKAQWVRENGYGGILIWEVGQDDVTGSCCTTRRPLINAVNYGLLQKGSNPSGYHCE